MHCVLRSSDRRQRRVLLDQRQQVTRDGAQAKRIDRWRTPANQGHAASILGKHRGVGSIGLAAAQRLRKPADHLRIQHRQLDPLGRMQGQRQI
jgi:hypothetical protein